MSTPIQRYDIYPVNYQTLKEETDPTGEWVRYEDHAAALDQRDQRIAELEAALARTRKAAHEGLGRGDSLSMSNALHRIRSMHTTPDPRDAGGDEG